MNGVFRSPLEHDPGLEEGACKGLEEVALCMGQLGFRYISFCIWQEVYVR